MRPAQPPQPDRLGEPALGVGLWEVGSRVSGSGFRYLGLGFGLRVEG